MRRFFGVRGGADRLERELRAARPEPRADFLLGLTKHVAASSSRHRPGASRAAFALALTTFVIGSFASFGGLGYASAGFTSAATVVKNAVVHPQRHLSLQARSSAQAEYPPPKTTPALPAAGAAGEAAGAAGGQLPFTGISLVATLVIGFSLLAVGLILRRHEKRQT